MRLARCLWCGGKRGESLLLCLLLLACSCASPVHDLWPPPKGEPSPTIVVSIDTWHAMIAFPLDTQRSAFSVQRFEEWGYAEQGWYLEGRQGIGGVVRALFWPTAGVVEVGEQARVWADRTPQPPADRFSFQLSQEGYRRLRQYLEASIGDPDPIRSIGNTRFFPAARAYHLFHHCHQYTALALREAGLPVSAFWAITRGSFAWQLRRAEKMAATSQVEANP